MTMQSSFRSFGIGLLLAVLLVYLVLVAQFSSFVDPFLIVLAVPTGLVGVMLTLAFTDTTLNIQSLMGIVMLPGMVVSNSILIVDFCERLRIEGHSVRDAVATFLPHPPAAHPDDLAGNDRRTAADGVEAGNRKRGLRTTGARHHRRPGFLPIVLTIFVVPAAYLLIYQRRDAVQRSRSLRGGGDESAGYGWFVGPRGYRWRHSPAAAQTPQTLTLQAGGADRDAESSRRSRRRASLAYGSRGQKRAKRAPAIIRKRTEA